MPPKPGDPWIYPWGPYIGRAVELCPKRFAIIWLRSKALYHLDPEFYCALHRLMVPTQNEPRVMPALACDCWKNKSLKEKQKCARKN